MRIASKIYPHCATEIEVSPPVDAAKDHLTVVISSGSARMQTYATPAELRKLAHELMRAVDAYENARAEHAQAA